MSRKPKKPPTRAPVAAEPAALRPLAEEAAAVDELVRRGRATEAMDLAKARCKRDPSAEALLARAFGARIDELLAAGKARDAEALLKVALVRVPAQAGALAPQRRNLALATGDAGPLLSDLVRPDLPEAVRAERLAEIRRRVTDPAQLAGAAALPADHPLRVEAGIVSRALTAVTSGPVDEAILGLEAVDAESPLFPWATLVRAIAALYRGDDRACLDLAATLPPDTPPGRMAPVFARLLSAELVSGTSPAEALLRQGVIGDPAGLARALDAAERAATRRSAADLARAFEAAERAAAGIDAEALQRLRRMIWARAVEAGIPEEGLARLSRWRPVPDAGFWEEQARMALHAARLDEQFEAAGDAIQALEEWRRHGVAEGRIRAGSPEAAALLLQMALLVEGLELRDQYGGLLDDVAADQQDWLHRSYQGTSSAGRERGSSRSVLQEHRDAGELFARAAAASPGSAVFGRWHDWASDADEEDAEAVAFRWVEACPDDPEPHHRLVLAALWRSDPEAAQTHLDAAVARGAAGEAIRELQVNVPLMTALRSLHEDLPARVEPALSRLDAAWVRADPLPGCLHLALALRRGDADAARRDVESILAAVGDPAVAHVLASAAELLSLQPAGLVAVPEAPEAADPAALARAVTRAVAITSRIALRCPVPAAWRERLLAEVTASGAALSGPDLLRLADAAEDGHDAALVHAAMAASLAVPGKHQVEALAARSRDLPAVWPRRAYLCYRAALDLHRDWDDAGLEELVLERGDELAEALGGHTPAFDPQPLPRTLTARVIARESADRVLPAPPTEDGDWWNEADREWVERWRKEDPDEIAYGPSDDPWDDEEDEGWREALDLEVSPVMSRDAARRKGARSAAEQSATFDLDRAHLTAFHEACFRFGTSRPPVEGVRPHDPELAERLAAAYAYLEAAFGDRPPPGPSGAFEEED